MLQNVELSFCTYVICLYVKYTGCATYWTFKTQCVRDSQDPPHLGNKPWWFVGWNRCWMESLDSGTLSYSQWWFIAVRNYRLKAVKGKGAWGEVQGKPGTRFQVSPSNRVMQGYTSFSQQECGNSWEVLPTWEAQFKLWCPGFLLGSLMGAYSTYMTDLSCLDFSTCPLPLPKQKQAFIMKSQC